MVVNADCGRVFFSCLRVMSAYDIFLLIAARCVFQVRWLSRWIPRNFVVDTSSIDWLPIDRGLSIMNCFLWGEKIMYLVLLELMWSLFAANHILTLCSVSFALDRSSSVLFDVKNIVVSSAKERICSCVEYWMSLIHIRKRRGPRTEPWGTPWSILWEMDLCLLISTYWFLFDR